MVQEQVTVPTTEKDSAYAMLEATFGCLKGLPVKRLTREEKNQIAENLLNNLDKQDEIWKRAGLKKFRQANRD